MVNFAQITSKIDRGRGIAGKKLGQPFAAYRIVGGSSGDFPDAWQVIVPGSANGAIGSYIIGISPISGLAVPSFNLLRRRFQSTGKIETGLTRGVMWFEIIASMAQFVLGDVFLQTDPNYEPGVSYGPGATLLYDTIQFEAMALAAHTPVGKSIGGRLDRRVRIHRPSFNPATLSDNSQFFATTLDNDLPLVLSNGEYGFGAAGGVASFVPAGFSAYERPSGEDMFGPHVPAMPKPTRYFIYVPPLPGWSPTEGDALVAEDGSRYVVEVPFYQEAGVVGSQLVCHRQIRQNN